MQNSLMGFLIYSGESQPVIFPFKSLLTLLHCAVQDDARHHQIPEFPSLSWFKPSTGRSSRSSKLFSFTIMKLDTSTIMYTCILLLKFRTIEIWIFWFDKYMLMAAGLKGCWMYGLSYPETATRLQDIIIQKTSAVKFSRSNSWPPADFRCLTF
jgi:hypothetical protein